MKTNNSKNIFLFTKDLILLDKIRKDIYLLNIQISIFVNKKDFIQCNKQDLIIIDQRYFKDLEILPKSYFTKIIYITNNSSSNNIEKILQGFICEVSPRYEPASRYNNGNAVFK